MDIEQFYDEDPRRRDSRELEYGRDWSDANGGRCELSWVEGTGELYVMAEPNEPVYMDPVGDTMVPDLPTELVTVEVLAIVPDQATLDELLAGWQEQMATPHSIAWVRERLASLPS